MGKLIDSIPTEVTEAVAESLSLFRQAQFRGPDSLHEASQPLPSLLERCQQYINADQQPRKQPIRLIHHFACTGGTLITKCLACSPNVQVLSEVDPLSPLGGAVGDFSPSDLISLALSSNRVPNEEEKVALFLASFAILQSSAERKGLRLLIRDHPHSHYCVGEQIPPRPSVPEMLRPIYSLRSVVTVRHPIDSWLSLKNNGWVHFEPQTVDQYAQRYHAFLSACHEAPIYRYEDFLENPDSVLHEMCRSLALTFPERFTDLFTAHTFSGDSGRKSGKIEPRPRRSIPEDSYNQIYESGPLRMLCERLGYDFL